MRNKILLFLVLLNFSFAIQAQQTLIYKSPYQEYRLALDLVEKQMYSKALVLFTEVSQKIEDKNSLMYADCKFYIALCSYELLNNDAEFLLENFINTFSENANIVRAEFLLANLHYRERRFSKALKLYSEIDIKNLNPTEQLEYNFKYGYSAFMQEEFNVARNRLSRVKDTESHYANAAKYYFAHIAYTEGNYATALEYFKKVTDDKSFGPIVPYYIIQILHFQRNFDEIIEYGTQLINLPEVRRLPEIQRIVGFAHYNKRNYKEAEKHLVNFQTSTREQLTQEDFFAIGFSQYMNNNFSRAIENLQNAIGENDTISQKAHFHIADAYLKLNNNSFARTSFLQAHKLNIDQIVTEDALFNFAKLSIELSQNPYNEAISALQEYIKKYPNSKRIDEANEYMVKLYMQTRNYREALISLESIKRRTENINLAHQRISFFRGIELFNDRNFTEAIKTFDISLQYPIDRHLRAETFFWKGEAFYCLNNIDSALANYNRFTQAPGAISSENYNVAFYNIAYCHFNNKDFRNALTSFRLFLEKHKTKDHVFFDANIRLGDTFFALGRFSEAVSAYNQSVGQGVAFADYALMQRANSKGALGNHTGKIADLELLIRNFPNSRLRASVLYELGNTNLIIDNEDNAISNFRQIVNNHSSSVFHAKSMLKIGLTLYNQGKNEEALIELKEVVKRYQGGPESREALDVISKIYTDLNRVEDFFAYVKNISGTTVSLASQDTLTYVAAENAFMKGDCFTALPALVNYIEKFPNGQFILNAQFYAAECNFMAQKFEEALNSYRFVINRPWNRFSETSLLKAARVSFTLQNWNDAISFFKTLEEKAENLENVSTARLGLMRSYFRNNDFSNAIKAAQNVVDNHKNNQEHINEANSIIGISAFNIEDYALANSIFNRQKNLKSELGAEAFHYLAQINYNQSKYDDAEKLIFELINKLPSYEHWIARSFLLLSDIYVAKGNIFQAKHTLRSLIDNYSGVELVEMAKTKLAIIEQNEVKQNNNDSIINE